MTTVQTLPLNGWIGLELDRLNGDCDVSRETVPSFINVLDAVDVPVVVINGDITVAGFNQAAVDVLGFAPSHIGLSLCDLPAFGGMTNLKASCEDVITGAPAYRLDFSIGDKAFVVRIAPCGNIGQPAAGAVLTFANVTAFRASIDQAIYEREFTKGILNTVAEPLVVLGPDARIRSGNRAFHAAFRMSRDRSQGVSIYELAEGAFDVVPLRTQLSAVLAGIGTFEPIEVNYISPNAGPRTVVLDARPLAVPGQANRWVLLTLQDITARKQAEDVLRRNEAWLSAQTEAFQEAMNGAPLAASLGILIRAAIEQAGDQRRCAFYIADDKGGLHHVVGMPHSYASAVDGFAIGPELLACRLAVGTGRPVITPDVREEPRWKPWLSLAEEYDYRGCWSFPVEAAAGKVVGSFAMYFREPRDATPRDRELAESLTHAAAIIISRHQEAEDRARVGRQFETLLNQSPLGVYLVNSEFRLCEANPIARSVFGEIPDLIGRDFDDVIHILWPKPDADEVVRHFRHTLETGESYQEGEWIQRRLDRNVTEYYEWRIDRIHLAAGSFGVVCYFQDISDHIAARERLQAFDR